MVKCRAQPCIQIALFSIVALLIAACNQAKVGPTATPTPSPAPAVTRAATKTVMAATSTLSAVPDTPTTQPPPTDLCREYLHLSVFSGNAKKEAVTTSYHCHNAHVDSTGRSPSRSPDWVAPLGAPIDLQLDVERQPTEIEVRLYPKAGASASFMRWPEELPTPIEAVAEYQPEPGTRFEILPQVPPGPYSLVVQVAWGEEVEVFYAISLELADTEPTRTLAAVTTPTPMPKPTLAAVTTPTPMPKPTLVATATPTPASIAFLPEQAPDEVQLEVVQQIGGRSQAVAVDQGRVYLGIGPRLVVLDGFPPFGESWSVGQSQVLPGLVQDVHPVGDRVYVAAGSAGLILLDVTGPSKPELIGSVATPGEAQAVVVAPERGLAYVAGRMPPREGPTGWVSIVDVSQPERPVEIASIEVHGPAYDIVLVENTASGASADVYAYVAHVDGLLVLDVLDPAAPRKVANITLYQGARAVAVADGYAYVAGEELHVIDLSDPAQPNPVGHLKTMFHAKAVAVSGERAYVSDTFCEMGHCGSTLYLADVSDPTRPREMGTWSTQSAVEDMAAHEDALYLASWQKGLQALDVSDPAASRLLGEYPTLGSVDYVAVSDDWVYVSDGAQSGLQVLEMDKASHLRLRGNAESARWASGYTVVGPYAYVPMWVSGLSIVDVRDPDDPQEAAVLKLGQAEQAVVVGERAYVTIGYEGLAVLDVADPLEPRILGALPLEGLAEGLAVAEERAYVTVDDGEGSTLYAIDVADPAHPVEIGRVALQDSGLNVALAPEAGYAYVAVADCTYYLGAAQCSGGLQVVDIGDPSRPQTVLVVEMPGGAHDVVLDGQYAIVAAGSGGVWAIDVSDPETPRAVGWRDTAGRARNIAVADGRVYVADETGGLLILARTMASSGEPTDTGAAGAPQIASFNVTPAEIEPGDVVTLTWETSGDRAILCPSARFSLFAPDDCRQVPLSGKTTFTVPSETGGNRTVDFLLTVAAEGTADPAVWQTSVAFKCHRTWFYSDEPQAGICPLEPLQSYAAAQRFERGTIIWIEQLGRYVILEEAPLDDGGVQKRVSYIQDPLDIVQDTSANVTAPDGLQAPTSGFGLVWRGDVTGSPGFRETLGWALAPEFGYDAILQCDDALPSGGRSWQTCALLGPEDEVIGLDPLGRWELWD